MAWHLCSSNAAVIAFTASLVYLLIVSVRQADEAVTDNAVSNHQQDAMSLQLQTPAELSKTSRQQMQQGLIPISFDLVWFAPFLSQSGYGSEARSFAAALALPDFPSIKLQLVQHGDDVSNDLIDSFTPDEHQRLEALLATRTDEDLTVVVCHSEPGAWNPPHYQTSLCPPEAEPLYSIGRTMFETDRIPKEWVERCKLMDEIWVPTEFHKRTFTSAGVPAKRVVVVAEGVDTTRFHPTGQKLALPIGKKIFSNPCAIPGSDKDLTNSDRNGQDGNTNAPSKGSMNPSAILTYLSVFKWEPRKGWDILLPAFVSAFAGRCDVQLQLITSRYHSEENIYKRVRKVIRTALAELECADKSTCFPPSIYVMDGHLPDSDMPKLYRSADVFVLPSRGEGFGRPHVEAMAIGVPVIATNWSGVTAYLTEDNGYPLRINGLVEVGDGPFSHHRWAQPDADHLVQLLRKSAGDKAQRLRKGWQAREDVVMQYSLPAIARQVRLELQRIQNLLIHRDEL